MFNIDDGSTDHNGSAAAGRGVDGGEDHACDAHVPPRETSYGRVRVPKGHHHAQPEPRRIVRARSHPGSIHDVPQKLPGPHVSPATHQVPGAPSQVARGQLTSDTQGEVEIKFKMTALENKFIRVPSEKRFYVVMSLNKAYGISLESVSWKAQNFLHRFHLKACIF